MCVCVQVCSDLYNNVVIKECGGGGGGGGGGRMENDSYIHISGACFASLQSCITNLIFSTHADINVRGTSC